MMIFDLFGSLIEFSPPTNKIYSARLPILKSRLGHCSSLVWCLFFVLYSIFALRLGIRRVQSRSTFHRTCIGVRGVFFPLFFIPLPNVSCIHTHAHEYNTRKGRKETRAMNEESTRAAARQVHTSTHPSALASLRSKISGS